MWLAEVVARSPGKLRSAQRSTLAGMTELRVNLPDDVAERLASEAAVRGTSAEDLAADLLRRHVPPANSGSLSFVGMFDAPEHGTSVSEAERQLEDGDENGFAR